MYPRGRSFAHINAGKKIRVSMRAAFVYCLVASMPPAATQAINDAQAWMAASQGANPGLPYGVPASSTAGQQAVALSEMLDRFDNGRAGPPHGN
jgi:hypothetical protein